MNYYMYLDYAKGLDDSQIYGTVTKLIEEEKIDTFSEWTHIKTEAHPIRFCFCMFRDSITTEGCLISAMISGEDMIGVPYGYYIDDMLDDQIFIKAFLDALQKYIVLMNERIFKESGIKEFLSNNRLEEIIDRGQVR